MSVVAMLSALLIKANSLKNINFLIAAQRK